MLEYKDKKDSSQYDKTDKRKDGKEYQNDCKLSYAFGYGRSNQKRRYDRAIETLS